MTKRDPVGSPAGSRVDNRVADARPSALDRDADPARQFRELQAAFSQPATVSPRGRSAAPRRRPVLIAAAGGLAVAVVAAAVTFSLDDGPAPVAHPPADRSTATPAVRAMSARHALGVAAAAAAAVPATDGAFWHTETRTTWSHRVSEGGYLVESRRREHGWTARDPKATSWSISQELGGRPIGGGPDARRPFWTAALAPRPTCVAPPGKVCVRPSLRIAARPGRPVASPSNFGSKVFALGHHNVSVRELRSLPADQAKLKATLLSFYRGHSTEADDPMDRTAWLFTVGTGLVTDMPISPGVRAAAFRMLADLPGVRLIENARDALGRTGSAVGMTIGESSGPILEHRLILDLRTGAALAHELLVVRPGGEHDFAPGTRSYSEVVESAGWTDDKPVLPRR